MSITIVNYLGEKEVMDITDFEYYFDELSLNAIYYLGEDIISDVKCISDGDILIEEEIFIYENDPLDLECNNNDYLLDIHDENQKIHDYTWILDDEYENYKQNIKELKFYGQ